MEKGKLFIVATPIGNLGDISLRALETLKKVDFILCEDTRQTDKLLSHFRISKPTISYHQHSLQTRIREIHQLLREGKNLALVTDAGTPGISDPGNKLISELTNKDFSAIIPIPGPSALTAVLSVSGFPTDKFFFAGFPPSKNKRQKFFKELAEIKNTIIFYESTHRIIKTLEELRLYLAPRRRLAVGRELTKQFETIYRGQINEIIEQLKKTSPKGELAIVIEAE